VFGRIATLVVFLVCFHASSSYCQTLHLISVADSKDSVIGTGAAANSKALASYVGLAAVIAKLSLDSTEIAGDQFSCTSIANAIETLKVKDDDVIVFYYSGHGFAPAPASGKEDIAAQSQLPWLYCDPPASRPNLEAISRQLAGKGARLTITVADACNVIIPVPEEPLKARGVNEDNIQTLFRAYKGNILFTSSKRQQYSWYYSTGGLFTEKLLRVLRNPPDAEPAALWEAVFERLREPIEVRTPSGPIVQAPEIPAAPNLVFLNTR
jgi:hypothetical protein